MELALVMQCILYVCIEYHKGVDMEYGIKDKNIPAITIVTRPWGFYKMFVENQPCTAKILHIRPGEMLSLQYHRIRTQVYYIMDEFSVYLSDIPIPKEIDNNIDLLQIFTTEHVKEHKCKKGDINNIPKFVIHRPFYSGIQEYGCIVDMAFGINDENDIFRIKDKYVREECQAQQ